MIETLNFLFFVPFQENIYFPIVMIFIFIVTLVGNMKEQFERLSYYKNNIPKLIFDDWKEAKSSEGIPGVLMSIGIIGTFYLIYASLSHFDINKLEEVSEIITNHIAPAFSISALGILLSILYIFAEKIFIFSPYKRGISRLTGTISYVDIAIKQLTTSKKLLLSTEEQTKAFSGMSDFSESLGEAAEGMKMFGEIAVTLEETLNPEVLGKVISDALITQMKPTLDSIQDITSNVDNNSQKITKFLEEDLKNEIIIPLKKSVDNTSKSMINIEHALVQTTQALSETNKGFEKLNSSLNTLESLQESFVKKLDDVLDKQRIEFDKTTQTITDKYSLLTNAVANQIDKFNTNSKDITDSFTGLSTEMKEFLIGYKEDYKELLTHQEKAIKDTSEEAVKILSKSGEVVSKTITDASDKMQSTLSGVDDALIKTSKSIKEELENFKNSYTESLKGFLDSQEEILNKVFKEQTERLSSVVVEFQSTLESDVNNRKILNTDLEKLVQTTNGFVASTQAMISTAFEEQQAQLIGYMENNKSMQSKLMHIVDNASDINDNGNTLTKELIDTTANLQKLFNDHQSEVLEKYQTSVDEHLKDILNYMATIIEASHISDNK